MKSRFYLYNFAKLSYLFLFIGVAGCSGNYRHHKESSQDSAAVVISEGKETDAPVGESASRPGDPDYHFEDGSSISAYLDTCRHSSQYSGGILPVIAREVPEYAEKLIANRYDSFIIVDKASMRVILYDRYGNVKKAYDMACAKNYGTKHKKADSRTPEGFFEVEGIYNSTDWLYTDDDGVTSKKKGQFGPRFIRLKIPVTSQIGIHRTCSPWSIGHRASHGCIRLTNDNIMELVELVEPGMPVIVLPGKRDRAVNREEGCFVPYFPTEEKYAMTEKEKSLPYLKPKKDNVKTQPDSVNSVSEISADSVANIIESGVGIETLDTVKENGLPNDSV